MTCRVFTCTVERCTKAPSGVDTVVYSRLNFVDLAGSERIYTGFMGGSQVRILILQKHRIGTYMVA